MSYSSYLPDITGAASANSVPSGLLAAVLGAESNFNPTAYNPASGAMGIAQFLPSTAADPGYGIAPFDPNNPSAAINGAGEYLSALYQQTGSWTQAVQAYGTVPAGSDGTGLTPGQANVYQIAYQADQGNLGPYSNGMIGGGGMYVPPNNIISPTNPNKTAAGGPVGSFSGALTSFEKWAGSGTLRVGIFVLALILFGVGVVALANHSGSVTKAVSAVVTG